MYEILNKCVIRLAGDLVISSNSSNNKKLNEKITNRILPLLNVFIEWIQSNAKYMPTPFDAAVSATINHVMGNLTPKLQELVSSEQIVQILSKSVSTLSANMQNLRAKYSSSSGIVGATLKHVPLPEHTELNGFLPLREVHSLYFNTPSSRSLISHEVIAVPDDVSKSRRISTLLSLFSSSTEASAASRMDEESMNQVERVKEDVMQVQVVHKVVGGLLPISVLNNTTESSSEKKKIIKKPKKNHEDKRLWTPSSSAETKSVKGDSSGKRSANKRGTTTSNNGTRSKGQSAMDIDNEEEVHEEEGEVVMMEDDTNAAIPSQENVANTMFGVPGMFNWLQDNEGKVPQTAATAVDMHGNITNGSNYFEQDVEEEEEVVFRPAFSRVRSNSPAAQLSCSLRGIQSQSSFGDLLLGSSTDATRTWSGVDPGYPQRTIFSNIIDTTFALLDDSAESERNKTYSYQTQHSSSSFHVQPPPGFG